MSLDRNKTEHFDQYLKDPPPFVISYSIKLQRSTSNTFHFNLLELTSGENLHAGANLV
jgi:hypothetical protein